MFCQSGICVPRLKSPYSSTLSVPSPTSSVLQNSLPEKLIQLDEQGQHLDNLSAHTSKVVKAVWSDWGEGSECESGCLYGESGRLKEGSTGLRIFQRTCGDYG